jgi:magnesium transporter
MKKRRAAKYKKLSQKMGMAPGSLVYVGDATPESLAKPTISKMVFSADTLTECVLDTHSLASFKPEPGHKFWLNVHGVHDVNLIKKIGDMFHLHPLVLEDILNTEQRAKLDEFDDYVFLETRMFYYDKAEMSVSSEQISMVLGENFLLTFQERSTGCFEPVRERLRAAKTPIRSYGVDYLAFALLDSVVDRYFKVLEEVSEASENLEHQILTKPSNNDLHHIHQLKHVSIELRRAVWPMREVVSALIRNEKATFKQATLPYLRDLYDHIISFIESLESIRDSLIGMMDIYMASMSQRVNLELRALTVVTMLFMPATLITGIFGMNFEHMPFLKDQDGFWGAIGLMLVIATIMLMIFWRRQWVSRRIFSADEEKSG